MHVQVLEQTAAERRAAYLAEVQAQQDAKQAAALAAIEAEEAARASATDVVAETFRKFDGDGGGTISRKELRAAMSSLGVELSKRGMKQLMKRFDEDDRCVYCNRFASVATCVSMLCLRLCSGEMDLEEFRAMIAVLMPHLGQSDEAS